MLVNEMRSKNMLPFVAFFLLLSGLAEKQMRMKVKMVFIYEFSEGSFCTAVLIKNII